MSRTTNRTSEYEARRATALHFEEHEHDRIIETRLRANHGHAACGWKASLVRHTLTKFAIRDADRNAR